MISDFPSSMPSQYYMIIRIHFISTLFYSTLFLQQVVAHAKSYINNIPPCTSGKETLLHESIGKILGMFVPEFDRLLRKLHDTEKLVSPTGPPTPLSHCQVRLLYTYSAVMQTVMACTVVHCDV